MQSGAALAAGITGYTLTETAYAQQLTDAPWSKSKGKALPGYETPSPFAKDVMRTLTNRARNGRVFLSRRCRTRRALIRKRNG